MTKLKKETVYQVDSLADLPEVIRQITPKLLDAKVVTLEGSLGAGKTTLVKGICSYIGIDDLVSSPTFSIINEYLRTGDDLHVYHMDLYRIEDEEELMNIGFEDYLYSGHLVFIEWPEIARSLLPSNSIGIHIEIFDNSKRRLKLLEPNEQTLNK